MEPMRDEDVDRIAKRVVRHLLSTLMLGILALVSLYAAFVILSVLPWVATGPMAPGTEGNRPLVFALLVGVLLLLAIGWARTVAAGRKR